MNTLESIPNISFSFNSAGFTEMYLSTHDKEKFYAHLGFEFSEPIKSLGANSKLISDEMVRSFSWTEVAFILLDICYQQTSFDNKLIRWLNYTFRGDSQRTIPYL